MSLVIVETAVKQPITDEFLQEAGQVALPCLQARGAIWKYSLLARDRYQMICLYDAPDAASVRDSYAKFGVQKRAIWAGELIQPQEIQPDLTERYVIEARYSTPSETDWNEVRQNFSQCCTAFGMNWLRSYLSLDRTRAFHELDAQDAETIHEAQCKFGISFDRVWHAHLFTPQTPFR